MSIARAADIAMSLPLATSGNTLGHPATIVYMGLLC